MLETEVVDSSEEKSANSEPEPEPSVVVDVNKNAVKQVYNDEEEAGSNQNSGNFKDEKPEYPEIANVLNLSKNSDTDGTKALNPIDEKSVVVVNGVGKEHESMGVKFAEKCIQLGANVVALTGEKTMFDFKKISEKEIKRLHTAPGLDFQNKKSMNALVKELKKKQKFTPITHVIDCDSTRIPSVVVKNGEVCLIKDSENDSIRLYRSLLPILKKTATWTFVTPAGTKFTPVADKNEGIRLELPILVLSIPHAEMKLKKEELDGMLQRIAETYDGAKMRMTNWKNEVMEMGNWIVDAIASPTRAQEKSKLFSSD